MLYQIATETALEKAQQEIQEMTRLAAQAMTHLDNVWPKIDEENPLYPDVMEAYSLIDEIVTPAHIRRDDDRPQR